jgi:hypothetical protein
MADPGGWKHDGSLTVDRFYETDVELMRNTAQVSLLRALGACALVVLLLGALASSAFADLRYANPNGNGTLCTSGSPCSFAEAIGGQSAGDGDEVVLAGGVYPAITATVVDNVFLKIHGVPGDPAVITSSAKSALEIDNAQTTLSDLVVNAGDSGARGLFFGGALAERVRVNADGSGTGACVLTNGKLRDSVCAASGTGADGVSVNGIATRTIELRNVTAMGAGTGAGVGADAVNGGAHLTLSLVNTIAKGGPGANDIAAQASAGTTVAVSPFHSDFALVQGGPRVEISADPYQVAAPPVFADAAFHEVPSSPTVDRGVDDPLDGSNDVDMRARTQGAATDIGASELVPVPVLTPPATTTPATTTVPPDVTAPVLRRPKADPAKFAVALRGHKAKPHTAYGTKFRFTLSEAARVAAKIESVLPGRKLGRRCQQPSAANAKGPACVRHLAAGSFTKQVSAAGHVALAFSGKLHRALTPGTYRLTLVATDPAGNRSRPVTLTFRVIRG